MNRPVNQLYHFEVNANEIETSINKLPEPNAATDMAEIDNPVRDTASNDTSGNTVPTPRVRRNAAIIGELKRQLYR